LLREYFSINESLRIGVVVLGLYFLSVAAVAGIRYALRERKHAEFFSHHLEDMQLRMEKLEEERRRSGLYIQRDIQIVNELFSDGTWTSDSIIEIEVVGDGELGIISHWNKEPLNRNACFEEYECKHDFIHIPEGHTWRSECLMKTTSRRFSDRANYVEIQFYIEPALKKGEIAKYRYQQKYRGTIAQSRRDLEKVAQNRRFLRNELKEIRIYSILSPTFQISRKLIFYDPSVICDVDVVALHRDVIDEKETKRLKEEFKTSLTPDNTLVVEFFLARQENLWVNSGSGSSPIVRNSAILRTS